MQEALSLLARAANRIIAENDLCLPVLQDLRMGFFVLDPAVSYLLGHAAILLGNLLQSTPALYMEFLFQIGMMCSLHAVLSAAVCIEVLCL